jgi:glucose/arabinose dehydrogenase
MKRRIAINGRAQVPLVWAVLLFAVLVAMVSLLSVPVEAVPALPDGFRDEVVFDGLDDPTNVEFSPDGRVFVAEKSGLIKVFDDLSDSTPTTFADLRTNVYNFWDRGLLGLALAPNFPDDPHVYVLYAYDAKIGGVAPRWGTEGVSSDPCPTPPGPTQDGCVVSGRLSRLTASDDIMTGSEKVLLEGWCQQYPSHSIGDLAFGEDGALYASGGDGASFGFADYGQEGSPPNPCGDPPGGTGAVLSPPTAEGGALRSQDLRTRDDPVGLNGAILRLEPSTGAPFPGNPLIDNPDPNARRIVAYGLRNPFRFTTRPGTNEL